MKVSAGVLAPGNAAGRALKLDEPLSLWGGVDLRSGEIVDQSHPQRGMSILGTVLAMTMARGSSSSSSALVELTRAGAGPCAIVLAHYDPIIVIGALVAAKLYGVEIPVVMISPSDLARIAPGGHIEIEARVDGATLTAESA